MRRFILPLVASACTGILLLASLARATPCFDYEQILPEVGRVTLPTPPASIVVGGSHAFVAGSDAGLQVVDVSDPAVPILVATLGGLGTLKDVALDGTLLYAGSTTGLHIIDVSNPALPVLLGSAPGSLESVDFHGKTVAAAAGTGGLRYYDVTDPATPVFVSALPLEGGSATEVLAHGDVFYVLAGFTLYAVSIDPKMPSILGEAFAIGFGGLAAEGATLFGSQMVYSIVNPSSPVLIGSYTAPSAAGSPGPAVAGGIAFGLYQTTLQLVDVDTTVPDNSRLVGQADLYGSPVESIEVAGGYAYLGTGYSQIGWQLQIIDVETPLVPSPTTVFDTPGTANDVAIQAGYAYVADGLAGLQVVDLADPWAPTIVGNVVTPVSATAVAVAGNLACVRQGSNLQVIDVSNPANPILAGTVVLPAPSLFAMTPGFVYVQVQPQVPGPRYLQVVDLSDPALPVFAGSVELPIVFTRIEITGTTACLFSNDTQFVDISNPAAPVLVGSTGYLGSTVQGMAVDGTRVYITELHGKFLVYDISNPAMPIRLPSLIGTYGYGGSGIAASRSTVYLNSNDYGFWTIDVGNSSASPQILSGSILEPPMNSRMCIADDVLVAAIGTAGLLVMPTQCLGATDSRTEETTASQRLVLRAAWPNPSRAGTTLQFELPVATTAELRIYDVAGRMIRELHAGHLLPAGPHAAQWDGRDAAGRPVANGVYIARLSTSTGVASSRVTLVR